VQLQACSIDYKTSNIYCGKLNAFTSCSKVADELLVKCKDFPSKLNI